MHLGNEAWLIGWTGGGLQDDVAEGGGDELSDGRRGVGVVLFGDLVEVVAVLS